MTIEELRMVNRICAYMQRAENMDYQTAYSFALAVVNNKEYIGRELNKGVRTNAEILCVIHGRVR